MNEVLVLVGILGIWLLDDKKAGKCGQISVGIEIKTSISLQSVASVWR